MQIGTPDFGPAVTTIGRPWVAGGGRTYGVPVATPQPATPGLRGSVSRVPDSRYPSFQGGTSDNLSVLKVAQHLPSALAWAIERYGANTGYIPTPFPRFGPFHRDNDSVYNAIYNFLRSRPQDNPGRHHYLP